MEKEQFKRAMRLWLGGSATEKDEERIERSYKENRSDIRRIRSTTDHISKEFNIWTLEGEIKRLPQAEQKDLIDKLVQNYEGTFGKRMFQ